MIKHIITAFCFIFYACSFYAQNSTGFYEHLEKNNFKTEQEAYIKHLENTIAEDSVSYFKTRYYSQYFNDSLFFINFQKSSALFLTDTILLAKTSISFLKQNKSLKQKWFYTIPSDSISFLHKQLNTVFFASEKPLTYNASLFPEQLQTTFIKHQKSYVKKPAIGATLSVFVPGLGKFYAGRKKSSVVTFFANAVFAAQSYEAINRLGATHPFSIFSMAVFGVFYMANIYGSYNDVKQVKSENQYQFIIDATNYYNSFLSDKP
jgi:TM2 domain-containing membrane protein YozV